MSTRRNYGDVCGIARGLDVVGERWALLVVRELVLGPKRFTDLRIGLPHIGPDVLSQRLRELSESGVIAQRTLPPPAASKVYELTPLGRTLEDALLALGRFGAHLPVTDPEMSMSFDSHILSFETLFDPARAGGFAAVVHLVLDGRDFTATVDDGTFTIVPELPQDDVAATISTDPRTAIDVAHGRAGLDDVLAAGTLIVDGDLDAARTFLELFPLPEPLPA